MTISHAPVNPYLARWMMFVDGENIIAGAQLLLDRGIIAPSIGPWYRPNSFIWIPPSPGYMRPDLPAITSELQVRAIRSYYYTTAPQNELSDTRAALWQLGFQAQVFPRKVRRDATEPDGKRIVSKGVDIALATDVLSNAFSGNFDTALLFAGDADYVPLVDQVKRLGRRVIVASFSSRLSPELKLASDKCHILDDMFHLAWQRHPNEPAPK